MRILGTTNPVAARPHKCIWCGQQIDKGEKHTRQAVDMNREFQDNRYHNECFEAAVSDWLMDIDEFVPYENARGTK